MNIQLIQHNTNQLEALVEQGKPAEAAKIAFALAKLLIQAPSEVTPRSLYGAYGGTVAAMSDCLNTLLETYQPTDDIAQMLQKIQQTQEQLQACVAESEEVNTTNQALLDEQQKLEQTRKKLSDKKAKIAELIPLKGKEIPALKQEIEEMETALIQLESECKTSLATKEKWMTVFDENLRLIADLPQSVQDKTADEIIAAAKAYAEQAAQADAEGDEWLRKVIAVVAESKERMKQAESL